MKLNLTNNEKRDVIKYLEAGKSLPEKYRFLLFKYKKEVELVWNKKTNHILLTIARIANTINISTDKLLK